jgi:TolB-like protein/Tfp pilus assembly protein PilF
VAKMNSFFRELKERKVYRVALGYAVVAWLVIQISATVLPAYHAPEWILPIFITVVALGFPVALVLAWAFEIKGGVIEKAPESTTTLSVANKRRIWLLAAVGLIISLVAVAGYWIWHPWRKTSTASQVSISTPPAIAEKSIAVLPFENLSRDPDNAYFAQGIQEEILTRLAKIADLKVISRTSMQRYQSKPGNLAEIAKQLGVAHILEGSVQKAADQVRVNVQLVNAQTDSHLWAETYDRKLIDIFSVESEIAKAIADSLQARLTGGEAQALAVKPTNNPEAYDAYLRGLAFEARAGSAEDALIKAITSYERAVQLDPNFAAAWGKLSRAHARVYFNRADTTAARRDAAQDALEHAQKLQPNSPETLLALGYYQYWVLRDYGFAKSTFALVSKMLPGSSEVPFSLGKVSRREGNWDESVAYLEQALALDPRNVELLNEAALTLVDLRQFPTALKLYDRALDILPNEPNVMVAKAGIHQAVGNLEQATKFLSEIDAQTQSQFAFIIKIIQLRLERNHGEAIRLLRARLAQFHFSYEIDRAATQTFLALTERLAGDIAGAKVTAAQARDTLEALCKNQPDNALFATVLSVANATLGEKESAIREAKRAIILLPSTKDRVRGPAFEENLAAIQTLVGENSDAVTILTWLLQTPYSGWLYGQTPVTPALLRLDPIWDPLRADPAFQKLCEERQP